MALDTGMFMDDRVAGDGLGRQDAVRGEPVSISYGEHIGEALRAAREQSGQSLAEVVAATKVNRSYLDAIEGMRLDKLPSRPFTIGFIRAYAQAVGLEPDLAVHRFKADNPERNQALRAPFGLGKKGDGRARLVIAVGVVVFAAILAWNIVQRAMTTSAPHVPGVTDTPATARSAAPISSQNPVALGSPTPPPPEATTPELYVTPGLPEHMAESDAAAGTESPATAKIATAAAAAAQPAPASPVFRAKGRVYGAPARASMITLQARKSASVVIHAAGGAVVFAQQLQAGEAYRAPMDGSLTVDVSEPADIDVYVGGQLHAPLAATSTQLGKIAAAPVPAPAPAGQAKP